MTHVFPLHQLRIRFESQQHLDWPARLAFALTFSRIPVTAVTVCLLLTQHITLVCWAIAVTVFVDIADGIVFSFSSYAQDRSLRESRRILDATVDRLFIWTTLFVSLTTIQFPFAVYSVIMVRELLLSLICGYPYLTRKLVYAANLPSRVGSALIALQFIIFSTTGSVPVFLTVLFCLVSVFGLALYLRRPKRT